MGVMQMRLDKRMRSERVPTCRESHWIGNPCPVDKNRQEQESTSDLPMKNCPVTELPRPQSLIAGLLFRSGVNVGKARSGKMRVLERVWLISAHWQKWTRFANMIANEDDCGLSVASGFRVWIF